MSERKDISMCTPVLGAAVAVVFQTAFLGLLLAVPSLADSPSVPEGVRVLRDLEYVEKGHERNRLDLYLPEKAARPVPLVVWIHGGGWQTGNKDRPPVLPLTARGYAVASINYRLSQHAIFPAQLHDCKAAIRWLRANAERYGVDGRRVGVAGASAGGHLAALLGTTGNRSDLEGPGGNPKQSSRVQAVVDLFGPANLVTLAPRPNRVQLIGGDPQKNPEKAASASPVTYVSRDSAPFLILHGDKDSKVPIAQSIELVEALQKAGVEATLVTVSGGDHGGPQYTDSDRMRRITDFFDQWLCGKSS